MTPDEFRKAGHELVDWIADYRETRAARAHVEDLWRLMRQVVKVGSNR